MNAMNDLGSLADLPTEYVEALASHNLVPLWPSLRGVLPPTKPRPNTRATHWAYKDIKPLLLQAGELTPIEKAERRVLVLANPGHGLDKMQASAAIYLGMQLLLPGEWAPSHRHTPNAVRMIVEGEGAYTTVDGEKCPMSRGDLILTPTGLWHEHGHDGTDPVVWLDVLDLPIIYYLETSYHVNGDAQPRCLGAVTAFMPTAAWCPRACLCAAASPTRCCATPGTKRAPPWWLWPMTTRPRRRCKSPMSTPIPALTWKTSWAFTP